MQRRQARQARLAPLLGPAALLAQGLATQGRHLQGGQERLAVAAGANNLHAFTYVSCSALLCHLTASLHAVTDIRVSDQTLPLS